jgi:hypothetical protein
LINVACGENATNLPPAQSPVQKAFCAFDDCPEACTCELYAQEQQP